jgi:hypothetical protein
VTFITLFLFFLLTRIMVAYVALNRSVLMGPVASFIKDKGFTVHLLNIFIFLFLFLFNMAFITADRPFAFFLMAFNAERVEKFRSGKTLVAVGAFFYSFIIHEFMMAGDAGDIRLLMGQVRHVNADGSFQGLLGQGGICIGEIGINAGNYNSICPALIV